jgi:hypothetical protein
MNMDLELKFLEDELRYEIDDWFFQQLSDYSLTDASLIVAQALAVLSELPIKNGWSQEVAGVITDDVQDPIFFVIEYLKQEDDIPILIDINPIEVDEYLDFILENKSIKSYIDESRVRDLILKGGTVPPLKNNNQDITRS